MAGGRSKRLQLDIEKPLLRLGNKTLLERSAEAFIDSSVNRWLVACSRWTPGTADFAHRMGYECIMTPGIGYHEDTLDLLERFGRFISVNADVPFVSGKTIDMLITNISSRSLSAVVPSAIVDFNLSDQSRFSGQDGKEYIWVGLNYVTPDPDTDYLSFDDPKLAININSSEDLGFAENVLYNGARLGTLYNNNR